MLWFRTVEGMVNMVLFKHLTFNAPGCDYGQRPARKAPALGYSWAGWELACVCLHIPTCRPLSTKELVYVSTRSFALGQMSRRLRLDTTVTDCFVKSRAVTSAPKGILTSGDSAVICQERFSVVTGNYYRNSDGSGPNSLGLETMHRLYLRLRRH